MSQFTFTLFEIHLLTYYLCSTWKWKKFFCEQGIFYRHQSCQWTLLLRVVWPSYLESVETLCKVLYWEVVRAVAPTHTTIVKSTLLSKCDVKWIEIKLGTGCTIQVPQRIPRGIWCICAQKFATMILLFSQFCIGFTWLHLSKVFRKYSSSNN